MPGIVNIRAEDQIQIFFLSQIYFLGERDMFLLNFQEIPLHTFKKTCSESSQSHTIEQIKIILKITTPIDILEEK